jgi:integrase
VCPPGKRRVEFVDQGGLGLYVEVRASSPGVGTAYLRYKDANGKTCHQKIGSTAVLTVAEARREAKRIKAEITLGADPKAEKMKKREIPTFSAFFETMYMPHAKMHKKSWVRDRQLFEPRIRVAFGDKRLDEITRHQIQVFHASLAKDGLAPATANHHLRLIKHALYLAVDWQVIEKNPAARIPMLHEDNKVEHYMDDEQLQRLLSVLRTDSNRMVCEIALFLLATGCRLGEALSAKWTDVDLARRVFVVRASNSKSKKLRSVPLNDAALEVLERVGTQGAYEYVFANKETKGPYTRFGKVWERLRVKAELPHLRLHDLRHQYASFLVNSGRSLYDVQQILGHSSPVVTQRYAHLSAHALQEAASVASAWLTGRAGKPVA